MLPVIVAGLLKEGLGLLGNAVLSKGKEWLKDETGVDLDKGNLSSEDLLKLQQYQMDNEVKLRELQLQDNKLDSEIQQMYLADVQDARGMQKEALKSGDKFASHFIYYLTAVILFLCMVYIGAITFIKIPQENVRFADTILGFMLGTLMATIIAYFYGSSRGSAEKSAQINEIHAALVGSSSQGETK